MCHAAMKKRLAVVKVRVALIDAQECMVDGASTVRRSWLMEHQQ